MQAIHSAILDVNRDLHTQISYARVHRRVDQLRDRFYTFQWVENHPGVTWNHDERRLTADDQVWNAIARENLMARCYQNAYEPKWEKLCELFDDDETSTFRYRTSRKKMTMISDDENGTDLNVPKVLKDDGANSSNTAPPEDPPSKGK
ncbi:UNVERIFIED_CONTAM: hypothetical protein Sindi_0661500 [Sesamum indicum]